MVGEQFNVDGSSADDDTSTGMVTDNTFLVHFFFNFKKRSVVKQKRKSLVLSFRRENLSKLYPIDPGVFT